MFPVAAPLHEVAFANPNNWQKEEAAKSQAEPDNHKGMKSFQGKFNEHIGGAPAKTEPKK